jgi:RNA:NAD 2'-phosphotransferase (TPT1/KptA family)
VPLDRVLALPGFAQYNVDDIAAVVASNDKQRFSMLEEEGEAGGDVTLYIRANQVR